MSKDNTLSTAGIHIYIHISRRQDTPNKLWLFIAKIYRGQKDLKYYIIKYSLWSCRNQPNQFCCRGYYEWRHTFAIRKLLISVKRNDIRQSNLMLQTYIYVFLNVELFIYSPSKTKRNQHASTMNSKIYIRSLFDMGRVLFVLIISCVGNKFMKETNKDPSESSCSGSSIFKILEFLYLCFFEFSSLTEFIKKNWIPRFYQIFQA